MVVGIGGYSIAALGRAAALGEAGMGRYGQVWAGMGRVVGIGGYSNAALGSAAASGEAGMGRYGQVWAGMGRYGGRYGQVGCAYNGHTMLIP
jgi:hypothetical protein